MSTMTLNCTGGTFISYVNPNADNTSLDDIPTCCYFLRVRTAQAEYYKAQEANVNNQYAEHWDAGGALLEFEANNALKYKRIISAVLTYTLQTSYSNPAPRGGSDVWGRLNGNINLYGEIIAAYLSDKTLQQINRNNLLSVGTISAANKNNLTNIIPLSGTTYTRSVPITDLYKMFSGNKSRFLIAAGPDYWYADNETAYNPLTVDNCSEYTYQETRWGKRTINKLSAYITITYEDAVQLPPTPTYPINVNLYEDTPISFTWLYNSVTTATQKSATIQYKNTSDNNWTTVTQTGSQTKWILAEGLPQGSYEWRALVTNIIDESSAYSSINTFNVVGKPASPVINTPNNCCLTTISWNANGQEAAELMLYKDDELIIHETIATTEAEYKPQMFMKGNYSVKVRIKNNADLWSDFGVLTFSIDAAEASKGTLSVMSFGTYAILEGTASSTNKAIIRREKGNESVIAMVQNATDDTVAAGIEYEYILRTWDNGGYADSDPQVTTFDFEGAIFKTDTHEINLKTAQEKFLVHDEAINRNMSINNFVGREYPVIERGEFTTTTISKRFYVNRDQKLVLDKMSKEPAVFYRDTRGNAFKAVITELHYSEYMMDDYIAEITLLRTAQNEVVINV